MAKKAADMYIKQDGERKKAIAMIDRAIGMLGPQDKTRPNPYLTNCVNKVRDLVVMSASESKAKGPCENPTMTECNRIVGKIEGNLTGCDKTISTLRNGESNPFLIDFDKLMGPDVDPRVCAHQSCSAMMKPGTITTPSAPVPQLACQTSCETESDRYTPAVTREPCDESCGDCVKKGLIPNHGCSGVPSSKNELTQTW